MNPLAHSIALILAMAENEVQALYAHGRDDADTAAHADAMAQAYRTAEPFLRKLIDALAPHTGYLDFARARFDALTRYAELYTRLPRESDEDFIARASEQDANDPPTSRVFFWEFNA